MDKIGISSYGLYIPEKRMESSTISQQFNIPRDVVEQKQGVIRKHVSETMEMPSDMAHKASLAAIESAEASGISRKDISTIIYVGSQWKDYNVWLMSTFLQERLGLKHAFALDMSAMCAGMVTGLYLARSMLQANEDLRAVLLIGASKESYIVNPDDPKTSWMDDFADAGVAAVVARDYSKNEILKSAFMTDGSLSDGTLLIPGGARVPFYDKYCDRKGAYLESLISKEEFKDKLSSISLRNFKSVIKGSIRKSDLNSSDIRMIFLNHMKPSFHREILHSLNMSEDRSVYLNEYGHSQSADQFISLDIALKQGILKSGPVVFAAAGTGYVWSSTVIKWG